LRKTGATVGTAQTANSAYRLKDSPVSDHPSGVAAFLDSRLSDLGPLGDLQGVVDLNSKVADRALELGVSEK